MGSRSKGYGFDRGKVIPISQRQWLVQFIDGPRHGSVCKICGDTWQNHGGLKCRNPRDMTAVARLNRGGALSRYRTQKVLGLLALHQSDEMTTGEFVIEQRPGSESLLPFSPTFARPCPVRPRHGFVDSRVVDSRAQLNALWDEALAADPKAEMILMPFHQPTHSGILTTAAVTIGLGHDGATAVKAGCVTLPLASVAFPRELLDQAGVKTEPYLEMTYRPIGSPTATRAVQLRDGEKIKAFGNFVPADTLVKRVFTVAEGTELLAWEKLIASAQPGDVAHHPHGNMLSHYSVHCSLHNMPIVFDVNPPQVGMMLPKTSDAVSTDVRALRAGLRHGLEVEIKSDDWRSLLNIIFFATHQSSALRKNAEGCAIIGIAAALFARFGTAACLGELRHSVRKTKNLRFEKNLERNQVYQRAFGDYPAARNRLRFAWCDFALRKWTSAYGGEAWANCTANTIKLDRRISDVTRRADEDTCNALVAQLNVNVNLAHNGGWWLNKFTSQKDMNGQARGAIEPVARAAFRAHPLITAALLSNPLENYKGCALPRLPIPALQIYPWETRNAISWQCGVKESYASDTLDIGVKSAVLEGLLVDSGCQPNTSFEGSAEVYYKVNAAFRMALQIAYPTLADTLLKIERRYSAKFNPFSKE